LKQANRTTGAHAAKVPYNLGVTVLMPAPNSNRLSIRQKKPKQFICAVVKRPTTPRLAMVRISLLTTPGVMFIIVGDFGLALAISRLLGSSYRLLHPNINDG
jgi:hypothetical protein